MEASVSLCITLTARKPFTSWMCFFASVPGFSSVLPTNTDNLIQIIDMATAQTLPQVHRSIQAQQTHWEPLTEGMTHPTRQRVPDVAEHSLHPIYLYQCAVLITTLIWGNTYRLWIFSHLLSPSSTSSSALSNTGFPLTSPGHIVWGFMSGVSSWKSTASF